MIYFGFAIAFLVIMNRIGNIVEYGFSFKNIAIIVLSIVLGAGCIWAIFIYSNSNYTEIKETAKYELVTLQDDSQIEGKIRGEMFYIYGSINTEEVYNFYYKTSDDGFVRGKVDANKAVIYEKDDCKPVVIEYTTYTKSTDEKLQKWLFFWTTDIQVKNYKIYVPKGTVANEYSLDAK